jgi:hypothetical protein
LYNVCVRRGTAARKRAMSSGKHTTDLTYSSEDARADFEPTDRLRRPGAFARARTRREGVSSDYGYLWGWRSR